MSDDVAVIQIKIAGKSALVRNSLIGAAVAMLLVPNFTTTIYPYFGGTTITLCFGVVFGMISAASAWLGQVAARGSVREAPPINKHSILYSGLIGAWLGIGFMAAGLSSDTLPFDSSTMFVFLAMVAGLLAGAGLTLFVRLLVRLHRARGTAPQMLGEGQFDPLQQPQRIKEQARR